MENNNNTFGTGNGVATTSSSSVSTSVSSTSTKKKKKITIAKFVARLDKCPMTAKGFNKRAEIMGRIIGIKLVGKYRYATNGNRVTAKDASDFVQDGMLSILKSKKVDMAAFTYDGQKMTQGNFFALWLKASFQQVMRNDQYTRVTKKGELVHKISVSSIETKGSDANEGIAANIELAMLRNEPQGVFELDLAKAIMVQFNTATTNADKRFWNLGSKILEVETATIPTASACVLQGFTNANAYYVAKKRWQEDERLSAIRKLRNL
jgi:hypothetical protein